MCLSIKTSRLFNFLFFIQKENKTNLINFDLQKYLSNENFDLLYYKQNKNKICEQIKRSIGKQKAKQFQKIITSLKLVFTIYWRKEFKYLLFWKKYFQSNQSLFQRIISDIKKLSGIKHFKVSKISIYLISDPAHNNEEIHAWFSWSPEKSFIVVEISTGFKPPNNLLPVSILTHEFFHLILRENKNLFSKISEIAEQNKNLFTKLSSGVPNRIFLEELLISSFIPEGYLNEKYFHTKVTTHVVKPKNLLAWRKFVAYKLCQITKKYINNNQQIDDKYLKDLTEVIKHTK